MKKVLEINDTEIMSTELHVFNTLPFCAVAPQQIFRQGSPGGYICTEKLDSKFAYEQFQLVEWNLRYSISGSLTWVQC